MKYIEKISKLFNIDEIYIGLILKTIIMSSKQFCFYNSNNYISDKEIN